MGLYSIDFQEASRNCGFRKLKNRQEAMIRWTRAEIDYTFSPFSNLDKMKQVNKQQVEIISRPFLFNVLLLHTLLY